MQNLSRIYRMNRRFNPDCLTKFKMGDYRIELGSGDKDHQKKNDGEFIKIDIKDYGQDILWDIEENLPFPDNSASYIYASHFMEHLEDFIGVVNECWRVLKPSGLLYIVVPHKDSEHALIASHTRLFDKYSFTFFEYTEYATNYNSRFWKINELVVNERPDIHVKMSPIK